ncbi:MAG TPA: TIGR03862 family flavoprotein [Arenimonas sp.]|nr:TIGR03862 family flavoprotein [Arenimonas sp.]
MLPPADTHLAIIGGGPAGLMAAEIASAAGVRVELFDAMGSVGRKFLLAGKGGLNLTHSEPWPDFVRRYGDQRPWVESWLREFDADAVRAWARDFGVETFVGSSGRVFPSDLKAAPLLRGWVRHLRECGVRMHMHHRWLGWDSDGRLRFETPEGERVIAATATVLALGGGSWAKLGSDGRWADVLAAEGIEVSPLQPSNCGFDVEWTPHFSERFAGQPIKPVVVGYRDRDDEPARLQGEFVITASGIEGSAIYALSALLRDRIASEGECRIELDLLPGHPPSRLLAELQRPRGKRSLSEHLRRSAGLDAVRVGLLYEVGERARFADAGYLCQLLKALPLRLLRPRPIDEAISTAGGVAQAALDPALMLRNRPGVFCAGEMLDWEAPTGGYLLTAAMASGRHAARGALNWLALRS